MSGLVARLYRKELLRAFSLNSDINPTNVGGEQEQKKRTHTLYPEDHGIPFLASYQFWVSLAIENRQSIDQIKAKADSGKTQPYEEYV